MARMQRSKSPPLWRQHIVLAFVGFAFCVLAFQVVHLHTEETDRLRAQGDKRYLRDVIVAPERGRILDRNGRILSVSTPVDSLAADPGVFCEDLSSWVPMLVRIDLSPDWLVSQCDRYAEADFMYIKRRLPPAVVRQVMDMKIPGVEVRREYKRFYPGGPVSAHLVGFTDVDDVGQEGLELAFDEHLSGTAGRKRVLKDLAGHYVESVDSIRQVEHGKDLVITIDQRAQSMASTYLEEAVRTHNAAGGSLVVLAIPSGEIIAMANSPQFNPNDRNSMKDGVFRNRAVTDVVEPGSTAKPFTIAMALESGRFDSYTMVDTSPGHYYVGGHTITDVHNYGEISVFDVIVHSSNVGSAKIALDFPVEDLYETFKSAGFGTRAGTLPGEITGVLEKRTRKIEHATLAYGYGMSATALQIARAYTAFATDGVLLPVTLLPRDPGEAVRGERIFSAETVASIRPMLEQVATPEGTARKARIPRYRVGGKTGTTHKLINGNYINRRYVSLFAGMAPISDPKFVMVVAIDDPRGKFHYGGDVAAPVFSDLMADLMRLYNVKPDLIDEEEVTSVQSEEDRV